MHSPLSDYQQDLWSPILEYIVIVLSSKSVLFAIQSCYLDSSSGAAVATRAMAEALARRRFVVEALTGTMFDLDVNIDPTEWLEGRGLVFEVSDERSWLVDTRGFRPDVPRHYHLVYGGIPLTLHPSPTSRLHVPDEDERDEFFRLYTAMLDRFRPDVLFNFGGDPLAHEVRARARAGGTTVVLALHNLSYTIPDPFETADAVIVPSAFAADYYRRALGIECAVLSNLVDPSRVRVEDRDPRFLTMVNPSHEKGVYALARISDELGRRRPDIPILVVESRGTEQTVADCGLDLRRHGTVHFMGHTHDPRQFWGVTRIVLMPSLVAETQGLAAMEAMTNGIPVIASDRGALPETLGDAGIILPLPDRLTPATRSLPTADEVAPWVEAIIRLWDDEAAYRDHCRRARSEARRWDPEVLEPQYVRFFQEVRPRKAPLISPLSARVKAVVLVPHLNGIEWECEQGLRRIEQAGVSVVRRRGCSAIDVARNEMASEALHEGAEAILFIDADIGFDADDALRLLARPEPVVAGIYAKKSRRDLASQFADDVAEAIFGAGAPGLYPLKYAAAGFLRIRTEALRRMIERLDLPLCNQKWGRGNWPFFQPMIVEDEGNGRHYLGEDWAFSHRLRQAGITPMADTSIRLWHYGHHPFGWEDAGTERPRYETFLYRFPGARTPGEP